MTDKKLPLDPVPYYVTGRGYRLVLKSPGSRFNPRPGYSQNEEDYS